MQMVGQVDCKWVVKSVQLPTGCAMKKIAVLASPKLLKKRPIRTAADLLDCNLILSETTLIKWPQLFAQHDLYAPKNLTYTLSFDRSYMTLEAASYVLGFALAA